MSRESVVQLAQTLALVALDEGLLQMEYDNTIRDLARQSELLVQATVLNTVQDQSVYALKADGVKILRVLRNQEELTRTTPEQARSVFGSDWKAVRGEPRAWLQEEEDESSFRVVPVPTRTTSAFIFPFGLPLGEDYPQDTLVAIHTQARPDLLQHLDLPLALQVLSGAFRRESQHKDVSFADAAQRLAGMLI